MPRSTNSVVSSSSSTKSPPPLPYSKSLGDFEIERVGQITDRYSQTGQLSRTSSRRNVPDYNEEVTYNTIAKLISAKEKPFAISGHIPVEPSALTVFFRSQSGVSHALDFPIDVDFNTPPALDVLLATCKPQTTCELDGYSERESLFYPPTLPVTTTLELANHPILDAIRGILFPTLPPGHYLTVMRESLEVVPTGGHMCPKRRITQNDDKLATIIVTLPVRFRGGALIVHDLEGNEEKFHGRGGKAGDIEWTAFLADCDHEVETVQRGCRITVSYNIYLKTFGPSPSLSDSLIIPSDRFLDMISPMLNISRGRRIGFHLTEQYNLSPADVLAETLVPYLKGGDALLYYALKLYNLSPELCWTAGGYIWPVDSKVACGVQPPKRPFPSFTRSETTRLSRGRFSISQQSDTEDEADVLCNSVEESGAIPLAEAEILVITDKDTFPGRITKERVPYISGRSLDKLVVNVLLVVFVP